MVRTASNDNASPHSASLHSWALLPDDVLSDDSDFYGATETKEKYNKMANSYNPLEHWGVQEHNIQVVATKSRVNAMKRARELELGTARGAAKKVKLEHQANENQRLKATSVGETASECEPGKMDLDPSPLAETAARASASLPSNYYEGLATAKQLAETVSAFLNRLPPSTTPLSVGPWIWIANPYPRNRHALDSGDIAGFKQLGLRLLEDYITHKTELETSNPDKAPSTVTRMLRSERSLLEDSLVRTAQEKNVVNGKWMLFPSPANVDKVWATVAHATWDGRLGTSAKVATSPDGQNGGNAGHPAQQRLICIYTYDFTDVEDVKRVLLAMRQLGLVTDGWQSTGSKASYYKCDAYTYLDIGSNNEFKLKASMYSSRELLEGA